MVIAFGNSAIRTAYQLQWSNVMHEHLLPVENAGGFLLGTLIKECFHPSWWKSFYEALIPKDPKFYCWLNPSISMWIWESCRDFQWPWGPLWQYLQILGILFLHSKWCFLQIADPVASSEWCHGPISRLWSQRKAITQHPGKLRIKHLPQFQTVFSIPCITSAVLS